MSHCSRVSPSSQKRWQKRRGGEKLQKKLLDSMRREATGKTQILCLLFIFSEISKRFSCGS